MIINSRKFFVSSFSNTLASRFTSKKEQQPICGERKKIASHFKDLFQSNIELFCETSLSASVQTNAAILRNMYYLSFQNSSLNKIIKQTIEEKLENEINPQIALQVIQSLNDSIEGDKIILLKKLSEYFRKFFYMFEYDDLKSVENIFKLTSKLVPFPFESYLSSESAFKKQKLKVSNQFHTHRMLEYLKIELPQGVNVIFSREEEKIEIRFSKEKQVLTILGLEHGDYKGILSIKEYLLKNKQINHFIVEQPPFNYYQFRDVIEEADTQKEKKLKSMLFGGNTYTSTSGDTSSASPDQLLKHYEQIPILIGDMTKFYINQYILQQKNQYKLNETEGIIYSSADRLQKPNEFLSFIYHQMNRDKNNQSRILLADMSLEDEIYHQIQRKTNDQIQNEFKLMKTVHLNEQINWAIKVAKNGCPQCTQSVRSGPLDIINACGESDYDFSIRDENLATQSLNFMKINEDEKDFLMIVGNGHLLPIVKAILSLYSKEQSRENNNRNQAKSIIEYIESINSIRKPINFKKACSDLDFLNKFSLYSSYFNTNRVLLPPGMRNHQNLSDFSFLRKQYLEQFSTNNFLPENQRWKKQKGQEKCFALKQIQLI